MQGRHVVVNRDESSVQVFRRQLHKIFMVAFVNGFCDKDYGSARVERVLNVFVAVLPFSDKGNKKASRLHHSAVCRNGRERENSLRAREADIGSVNAFQELVEG